uniref:jupiter microtubule associated homolog 1-like n=1 Tax=Arvicanthis niloticus TaxID=61156 RepID=UPI00148605EF|nr:jupiter microtubule associated homolog 1-like [Arvicanthis niloticus]
MATTITFKGTDPNSRNSFQVLQPPNGESNFLLGFDEPREQAVGKNKWPLTSLRHLKKVPPSWAMSAGTRPTREGEGLELPGTQRTNSSEASSGDISDLMVVGEMHENVDTDFQGNLEQMEEKLVPTASLPSLVVLAPVPSRRNPSGGMSSLALS